MVAATPVAELPPGTLIQDPHFARHLLEDRRKSGQDLYDEVWDGRDILMPLPGSRHQRYVNGLATDLTVFLRGHLPDGGFDVFPGVNVTDREDDWTKNYRCPDVAVFLPDNPAEDRGSHHFGGPDIAVEILSAGDLTMEKLPFYGTVGVRELWVLDRDPWRLARFTLTGGELREDGAAEPGGPPVRSGVLPLNWALEPGDPPAVRLTAAD